MAKRFTHILVPTDFSPPSDAALAYARGLAQTFGARLSLLHVVTDPSARGMWTPEVYVPATPEAEERCLQEARQRLTASVTETDLSHGRVEVEAQIGVPDEVILEFVLDNEVDLIVMGTHGRTGLMHMLLGSVAERIVRAAQCPVLTTHAETDAPASRSAEAVEQSA
jgi:nucleotide-binding universal stress UspA family protein